MTLKDFKELTKDLPEDSVIFLIDITTDQEEESVYYPTEDNLEVHQPVKGTAYVGFSFENRLNENPV